MILFIKESYSTRKKYTCLSVQSFVHICMKLSLRNFRTSFRTKKPSFEYFCYDTWQLSTDVLKSLNIIVFDFQVLEIARQTITFLNLKQQFSPQMEYEVSKYYMEYSMFHEMLYVLAA